MNLYSLFCEIPFKGYSHYTTCFQVRDERVAKLLIDGFDLEPTIDVGIEFDTNLTESEVLANDSIYADTHVKTKDKFTILNNISGHVFNGNCQFCNALPAIGRVKDGTDSMHYCCSACGQYAIECGYHAVEEWNG